MCNCTNKDLEISNIKKDLSQLKLIVSLNEAVEARLSKQLDETVNLVIGINNVVSTLQNQVLEAINRFGK